MKKFLIILTIISVLTGCSVAQSQETGPVELEIGNYVFTADYLHPVKDYYTSDRSNIMVVVKEAEKGLSQHEIEQIVFEEIKKKCELEGKLEEEIYRSQDPTGRIDIPEGMSDLFEIVSLNKGKNKFYCHFFLMHLEENKDYIFMQILNNGTDKNELFDFVESVKIKGEAK